MNMSFPAISTATLLGLCALLTGCTTRSISDSSYEAASSSRFSPAVQTPELSEFDVMGVDTDRPPTEADIAAALAASKKPPLTRQSRIALVQSGADYPDSPMLEGLRKHFTVEGFTGRAVRRPDPTRPYSLTLRYLAAKGGFDTVVCYWGVLESERMGKGSLKAVSWVPVLGDVLPDEREHMRIRLKAIVLDVATGNWTVVTPDAITASQVSTAYSRKKVDQALVEDLKSQGYATLAESLARLSS